MIQFAKHIETLFNSTSENINLRPLSTAEWKGIFDHKPLQNTIEKKYGGNGIDVEKSLQLLETASYESISLTLIFGINIALFLEPLAKYGSDEAKDLVLSDFLDKNRTGGLMISEPQFGTDALKMETTFTVTGDTVKIKGVKHWQGLTGQADYWLVAGRLKANDKLDSNVSFCLVPQSLVKCELYDCNGLKFIQYGVNHLDLEVPRSYLMNGLEANNATLGDLLNRSRMQFSGMALGHVKRMCENAENHTLERTIRGKPLNRIQSVQNQLTQLQINYTLTQACRNYAAKYSQLENDLSGKVLVANTIKVSVAQCMFESSNLNVQLSGGNSFKSEHPGFTGLKDARPFSIFEGPNDMLTGQIGRVVIIGMMKAKIEDLDVYLDQLIKEEFLNTSMSLRTEVKIDMNRRGDSAYLNIIAGITMLAIKSCFLQNLKADGFDDHLIQNAEIYLTNQLIDFKAELVSGKRAYLDFIPTQK